MLRYSARVALVLLAAGCGGSATPKNPLPATVPVGGVVTLDGKPLERAAVKFIPDGETKGVECYGFTDESGRYELTQLRGATGAPPGSYKVVISKFAKMDGSPAEVGPNAPPPADQGAVEALPPRYSSYTASKLIAQVQQGGGDVKFELKSR